MGVKAVGREYRTAVFDNRRWSKFVDRPDDIFVCTPPKCGTTWMQSVVASLLWPDGDTPGQVLILSPWFDAVFDPVEQIVERLEGQQHRRFIKTHTPADGIPWFDTVKYVFVGRDGRDAFMSMCNHSERFRADVRNDLNEAAAAEGVPPMPAWDGDLHGFFARWLEGAALFTHVASFWDRRAQPNLLLVHYNDMKADLDGEMRRVAQFLGIDVPERCWPEVVERCTFDRMRERAASIGPFERRFEGGASSFLFKGTNGRWRDVLTPSEQQAYEDRVAELLSPLCAQWLEHGRSALDARRV